MRDRYGGPEVLRLDEVAPPTLADDAVLVRVRASSLNAFDWHMLRGRPFIARLGEGLRRPRSLTIGADAAGIVEAVGSSVTHVAVGDRVFGSRWGAFAELVAGRMFVRMPERATFEEAAAVPGAGCTALQAVRDRARLEAGQRVLILGAGGGVGTFAVQIARALGVEVTAVTSAEKMALVSSIGADEVLARGNADGLPRQGFDAVLDISGTWPLGELGRVVRPGGTVVLVAPGGGDWVGPLARLAMGRVRGPLDRRRYVPFLAKVTREDLEALRELVDAGRVRPIIDRRYELERVGDAIRYVESSAARGKVVITV
ncbi:MAG TPA: NAD(P)-dependent alcohol dehydrogenase [Candidatus Limnocylindrales bacterium]|nr:NAD(P)-dependent alcohol dehydrogenase [Candidatus Limnocylindrales bacterium]